MTKEGLSSFDPVLDHIANLTVKFLGFRNRNLLVTLLDAVDERSEKIVGLTGFELLDLKREIRFQLRSHRFQLGGE
jgi:hypothetical protein